ncbi:hypothetical protein RND71_012672 [Anisodus tanguticus]|uniref:NB-ARC domain-containing protein n=1 Tax=Anisodus tanguticus TaxID=243964 RepID=A0AAE1SF33_9SOLA|nr:hypothetical protein RND71_012672 [Anisodus tanguticus]
MASVAVISFIQTLKQLMHRRSHWISDGKMVDSLVDSLEYIQHFLVNTSKLRRQQYCGKVEDLERKIRTAVSEAVDVIELKIYEIKELENRKAREALCETLIPCVEKIDVLKRNVMGRSFVTNEVQRYGDPTNEDLQKGAYNFSSGYVEKLNPENIVVGLEDDLMRIIRRLKWPTYTREIVPILGMGGIGKTTLARKAYDDPEIRYHFDIHISQEYRVRDLLSGVVSCISRLTNMIKEETDDQLLDMIYKKEDSAEQLKDIIYEKEESDDCFMDMIDKKEESDEQLKDVKYRREEIDDQLMEMLYKS